MVALIAAKLVNARPSGARRTSLADVAEIVTERERASSPALSPDATIAVLDLKLWNAGGTKHRRISANQVLALCRHQILPPAITDARNICAAVFSRETIRAYSSLTSKHKPDAPTHAGAEAHQRAALLRDGEKSPGRARSTSRGREAQLRGRIYGSTGPWTLIAS
ncbi:hypothetical protein LRC39_18600 [Rhodopseudomonas sp. P1]|uniref:hypothetical protein n=1 Tax=Rhodopseudomonas sp. P1 TaxID=3434357 RepID=UPI0031FDEEAF